MILCIPNGYQPKKNCCQTDGSFSFRQVFKKSLSCEYNRSGRKVTYYIGCNFFMNSIDKKTWHGGVFMKKDEILNASRKEHRNKDLAEMEVVYQAGSHASRVGALVCCLLSLLSSMLAHTMIYSPWVLSRRKNRN